MMNESFSIQSKSSGVDHFELNVDAWQRGKFLSMCLTQDGSLIIVISTLQSCACFRPLFSKESSQICQQNCESTFITVILINEGLILPDLVQNTQDHALHDRFYLDTSNALTKVNMLQPGQLTCLWNKNRFPKYSQLQKKMPVFDRCDFSLLIEICNLVCFCPHR